MSAVNRLPTTCSLYPDMDNLRTFEESDEGIQMEMLTVNFELSEQNVSESGYSTDSKEYQTMKMMSEQKVPNVQVKRSIHTEQKLLFPCVVFSAILNPLLGIPVYILYYVYLQRQPHNSQSKEEREKIAGIVTKIAVIAIVSTFVTASIVGCGFLLHKALNTHVYIDNMSYNQSNVIKNRDNSLTEAFFRYFATRNRTVPTVQKNNTGFTAFEMFLKIHTNNTKS